MSSTAATDSSMKVVTCNYVNPYTLTCYLLWTVLASCLHTLDCINLKVDGHNTHVIIIVIVNEPSTIKRRRPIVVSGRSLSILTRMH